MSDSNMQSIFIHTFIPKLFFVVNKWHQQVSWIKRNVKSPKY